VPKRVPTRTRVEFAARIKLPELKKRDVDGTENAALRASFLLIFRSQIHSAADLKNETVRVRRAGGCRFSVLRQSQLFRVSWLPGPRREVDVKSGRRRRAWHKRSA
jgi:hypothetical protein